MNRQRLKERLISDEGCELKPYPDKYNNWTVGVGRLMSRGISQEEAFFLLAGDIELCEAQLRDNFVWFENLDDVRQEVLLNMCFQLGIGGLKKFRKFLKALEERRFAVAKEEMLDSKWAKKDSPGRANELSDAMLVGRWL